MGKPVEWNEVFISDTYFPISGPVRRSNFAVTPNPVLFGDTSKAGDSVAMTQLTQSDYLGGSGIHLGNVRTDTGRCWTSDLATYHHRALHLPEFVEDIGVPAWAAAASTPRCIVEYNGLLFVAFDDKVGTWSPSSGWSGAAETTFIGNPSAAVVWNQKLYMVSNAGSKVRDAAGVWTAIATFGDNIVVWDNKLWACTTSGTPAQVQVNYSLDGTIWTGLVINIPTFSASSPARLAVYRDSAGATALYVHTSEGLWIWDATFTRFLPTEVMYSPATAGDDWKAHIQGPDGRLYMTNGKLGVVAVQVGNPMIITPVGLDRDDGYPTAEDGMIVSMAADENFVYALQQSTTNTKTILRGYRGGWHKFYNGTGALFGTPYVAQTLTVATVGGQKSVYFGGKSGTAPKMYRMQMPSGVYNPRFFSAPAGYQAGPLTHVTPWWPFESEVQQKILGHVFVQAKNHTANETTKIEYALDLDESTWTLLASVGSATNPITSDGLKEFFVANAGLQNKWIRFRFTQQRGGTVTNTPIVEFYTAEVMRVLSATYAYSVEVDLSRPHRDKTPEQLRKKIEDLLDPQVTSGFYQFSWQDELGGVRTHYGRISRESGEGRTGPRGRSVAGRELLSLIVPYHRDVA